MIEEKDAHLEPRSHQRFAVPAGVEVLGFVMCRDHEVPSVRLRLDTEAPLTHALRLSITDSPEDGAPEVDGDVGVLVGEIGYDNMCLSEAVRARAKALNAHWRLYRHTLVEMDEEDQRQIAEQRAARAATEDAFGALRQTLSRFGIDMDLTVVGIGPDGQVEVLDNITLGQEDEERPRRHDA